MTLEKIAYCTGHYSTEGRRKMAKELRNQGYHVSFGSYIKENGKSYAKIYLTKDFNYYAIRFMKSVRSNIKLIKLPLQEAYYHEKEQLKKACKAFKTSARLELDGDTNELIVVVNDNEYELKLSLD